MADLKAPPRRRATQARSKATVQRILESATALIVERGAEPVTMTEIAQRADVVIGSVYQYFSDKSAIHRAILIRHAAEVRTMLRDRLSQVRTLDEFMVEMDRAFDQYFALHQQDKLVIGLWAIVQTDAELQAIDLEDTMQNARYVASVVGPMLVGVDPDELLATCVLLVQFALYVGRLARDVPEAISRQIPKAFKAMMRESMMALRASASEAAPPPAVTATRS